MKKQLLILPIVLAVVLVAPLVASADVVTETIANITDWIVTVSLGVALLMYVIGGFYWVIDGGNTENVKIAKNIILSTTVGLIVILIAKGLVSIVESLVKR